MGRLLLNDGACTRLSRTISSFSIHFTKSVCGPAVRLEYYDFFPSFTQKSFFRIYDYVVQCLFLLFFYLRVIFFLLSGHLFVTAAVKISRKRNPKLQVETRVNCLVSICSQSSLATHFSRVSASCNACVGPNVSIGRIRMLRTPDPPI